MSVRPVPLPPPLLPEPSEDTAPPLPPSELVPVDPPVPVDPVDPVDEDPLLLAVEPVLPPAGGSVVVTV